MTLPQLLERGFERMVDHVGTEVRQKGIWRGTLVHRRKDGSTFPASSTVVALKNRDGRVTHFVGVERDITDELKLRDQLVHSERLSAIGELVAGVAHEINNPLQTIIGCVELMIEERRGRGPAAAISRLVRQEAARAGQIVRNLLAFVRRSSPDRSAADLNQIARATARLREHQLSPAQHRAEARAAPGRAAGARQPRGDPADRPQPGDERGARHRRRGRARSPSGPTPASTPHTVQVVDDGPGHQPRAAGPRVRAVLHDQGSGGRDRARPVASRSASRPRTAATSSCVSRRPEIQIAKGRASS